MILHNSDFKYLDIDYGYTLPRLILGIYVDPFSKITEFNYDLTKEREWLKIEHQTAGISCHHHQIIGTILRPKPDIAPKIEDLAYGWLGSNCGVFGTTLAEIKKYELDLQSSLQVTCNESWKGMEEAIYPIDCTFENRIKLTDESLPEDLDDLINWEDSKYPKYFGCINRCMLILKFVE